MNTSLSRRSPLKTGNLGAPAKRGPRNAFMAELALAATGAGARGAAYPTRIPSPIKRSRLLHRRIMLEVKEILAAIEPG